MNPISLRALICSAATLCLCTSALAGDHEAKVVLPQPPVEDPFADRLLGDMGGLRTTLADIGLSVDLDGWYHFQGIADGGRIVGDDTGNLFSGRLGLTLDTDKAGLWPGGFLSVRVDGRAGDAVLNKAGAISPVNNAALLPLVPGRLGDDAWALTQLSYTQFLSEQFGIMAGPINTDQGDANPIAGYLGSNSGFMNTGMLYSPVVMSTVPTVTLGGAAIFIPTENIIGTFTVVGSTETAGVNPFDAYDGTTLATEWTYKYNLGETPGGMTLGGTYGIDRERLRFGEDPRVLVGDILTGGSASSDDHAWSIYWNGFQYLQGDEEQGWGLFGRAGFSDAEVTPIDWSLAGGIGGVGLIPGRDKDRWGIGVYYQDLTSGLLSVAGVDDEVGGELFYNMQLTPSTNLTFDLQVVDSAFDAIDTAVALGLRLGVRF